MDFCPIAPVSYLGKLNISGLSDTHLVLAHLVEDYPEYAKYYADMKKRCGKHKTLIMDNSAFELYRQGKPMFDPDKLIDLAKQFSADYIVLSDYPNEPSAKTIAAAVELAPKIKANDFGTFFVPQSKTGDLEDYIAGFAWAASSPAVDYIGMSILGCPVAFGVDSKKNIQTFLARIHMCVILEQRGLLQLAKANGKKIHFLGMTDGPHEIFYADKVLKTRIDSWDSSAPIWAGIQGTQFDVTPTGLRDGKIHSHVDFGIEFDETKTETIVVNLLRTMQLVDAYNEEK